MGLLLRSWNTNGDSGFFTDPTGKLGSGEYLPATYWWSRVLTDQGQDNRLRSRSLSWVRQLAQGQMPSGANATLPALGALDLGLQLARAEHLPFNAQAARKTVLRLRFGMEFSYDHHARNTSWSATALAAQDLSRLGAPTPGAIVARARQILVGAPPTLTASAALNTYFPIVLLLHTTGTSDGALAPVAERVAHTALPGLTQEAVATGLVSAGLLSRHGTLVTSTCTAIHAEPSPPTDPHVIADSYTLGCPLPRVEVPPYSVAGWPAQADMTTQMQDSLYGATVANQQHVLSMFKPALRAQVREWLSQAGTLATSGYFGYPTLIRLAHLVGLKPTELVGFNKAFATAARHPGPQNLPVLLAGHLLGLSSDARPTIGALAKLTAASTPIVLRATASVLTNTTDRDRWAAAAQREARQLASMPQRGGTPLDLLSLEMTAQRSNLSAKQVAAYCPQITQCSTDLRTPNQHPFEAYVLSHWDYAHDTDPGVAL